MAVPAVLMAVGAGMQAWSGFLGNMRKGMQGYENAKWLEEQAEYAQQSMFRELRRTEQNYANRVGQQIGDYASAGVDLSGSAGYTISASLASAMEELAAVRRKGEMDYKLAKARARLEQSNADMLTNPFTNLFQAGASLINSYAATDGFGQGLTPKDSASVASSAIGTGYQSKYLGYIGE